MVPLPPVLDVRTLYVMAVVPVKLPAKAPTTDSVSVLVPVTVRDASTATVTATLVVPVAPWARPVVPRSSIANSGAIIVTIRFIVFFFLLSGANDKGDFG